MRHRIIGLSALGVALSMMAALWVGPPPRVSAATGGEHTARTGAQKPDADQGGKDKEVVVEMSLVEGYSPERVEIRTGTTVVWRNVEPADYPVIRGRHQLVADDGSFASPQVEPGSSWAKTFLKPGKYPYHCGNHAHMTGMVVVKGEPISPKEAQREKTVDIVEPDPDDEDTWGFRPADVTVEVGTKVTWRNTGAQEHTATSDDKRTFDSGLLDSGESFSFTFKKPGVFDYHCKPHPWMTGTIRVAEPGKAPPPDRDDSDGSSSPPPPPPPVTSNGAGPTTHHVNIVEGESTEQWGFDPPTLQVRVGDTVVWRNTGSVEHTATEDNGAFDSGLLATGETFEHTFDEAGTFRYHCEPHPFMTATVVVSKKAPAGGSAVAPGIAAAGPPAAEEPVPADSDEGVEAQGAPALTRTTDERLLALLSVGALVVACAAFLVGRWWGQTIHAQPTSSS